MSDKKVRQYVHFNSSSILKKSIYHGVGSVMHPAFSNLMLRRIYNMKNTHMLVKFYTQKHAYGAIDYTRQGSMEVQIPHIYHAQQ